MKYTLSILVGFLITGCVRITPGDQYAYPPGKINHVVFFELRDQTQKDELIDDCYELLQIPGVTSGYVGTHYEVGRENVITDYDVGFFVAFDSEDGYKEYLEHPDHVSLVEKWKPKCDQIRVYDVGDARSLVPKLNR